MKRTMSMLCASALALQAVQAGEIQIRFHPSAKIWAHPLEHARGISSAVLQNTAIINNTDHSVTLEALRIDLRRAGEPVQSKFIDANTLDSIAKGAAALGASGMLQLADFHFAPKQLFGTEKPTLSAQRTLAPGAAFYLPQQFLAFSGKPEQVQVSVRLQDQTTISNALVLRHDSAPGNYRFPLQGRWLVGAGATPHSHHRWAVPEEFALDILKIGADGRSYRGSGQRMQDYYAYGATVMAVADGTVVAVVNDVPENTAMLRGTNEGLAQFQQRLRAGQDAMLMGAREHIPGNHVIVRHDQQGGPVYSVYAHLQRNRRPPKVGAAIKAGERLGLLGGTGNSTEPHLHFHLCDAADALNCAGMPVRFENIEIPFSDDDRGIQSGDTVIAN